MPTSVTHVSTGPLVGTGATNQVFPFDFEAISADEIEVLLNNVVVNPANYTVTLNGNNTGSITATLAGSVIVRSAPNFEQEANWDRFAPYFPDQIVPPLDKLARQDLWLKEETDRALKVPFGETAPILPSLAGQLSKLLGTTSAGTLAWIDRTEFKGDKGDPGGNVLSIGLFTEGATLSIPVGTDRVETSGYSVRGRGSAIYVYDPAVNSAYVSANPRQAFVAANGRGFKLSSEQMITPTMFGAVADGLTDDADAFDAAVAYLKGLVPVGGVLHLGNKHYRLSRQLDIDFRIRIIGQGWGQNPGLVNGTSYAIPFNWYGSVLIFDAGAAGLVFHPHTRITDVATVEALGTASYTEHSAFNSSIENVKLFSKDNGAAGTKDGIYSRTKIYLYNVQAYGFSRDGVAIAATAGSPDGALEDGTTYGNANGSMLYHVHAERNGRDGIRTAGRDANNITLIQPDCRHNGRWGLRMTNLIGNQVVGGHFDSNNRLGLTGATELGAICTTSPSAHHVLSPGPYIEVSAVGLQCSLVYPTMMDGGPGSVDVFHPAASDAIIINAGQNTRRGVSGKNSLATTTVQFGLGRDPGTASGKGAAFFGSSDDGAGTTAYRLKYQDVTAGVWSWNYRNAINYIQIGSGQTSWYATLFSPMFVSFPHGFAAGDITTAGRQLPAAAAMPTTGTYRKNDYVPNSNPTILGTAGGQYIMDGWKRLTAGSTHVLNTDWVERRTLTGT